MDLPPLLHSKLPDEAHEALRVANELAIADLASQSVSMDDFRLALQLINGAVITLNGIATSYAAALPASVADRQALHAAVDTLTASLASVILRVIALEQKPAVRNVATATPVSLGLLSVGARDITLQWDRVLPDTNYDPEWWPTGGLIGAASYVTKTKTTTNVVVTVKNTALIAAGGSLGAIAVRTA